jgi:hypothetical protein
MNAPRSLRVLVVVLALTLPAFAGSASPSGEPDYVVFLGQTYCLGMDWCPDFAFYGPPTTPVGYVELTDASGAPTDYLWVDYGGNMTFESNPRDNPPPPGLPLLGKLVETGTLQEVDQFFPAGWRRPLFIDGGSDRDGITSQTSAPDPPTLLLLGSAAALGYRRARRGFRS